jgi:hypothetical protein
MTALKQPDKHCSKATILLDSCTTSNNMPWQIISKPLHLTNQVHEPKTNLYKQPNKCKVMEISPHN